MLVSGTQSQFLFFSLACFNAKSFYVVLIALKFVTIETRGKSQSELASNCIKSSALLLTAMKNNSILFIHQGNNLVSLAWCFLFSHKNCKWFGKNSLFTSCNVKKKKVQLTLKGTEFSGFRQYLTWEKLH